MRLFLGVDPGDECRRRLASIIALLRSSTSGIRWVRDEKLHVTLAFLGEVDESRVPEIREAAQHVVAHHAPFAAAVSGSGVFPDWRRPRVVWLGLHDDGALSRLGDEINRMSATLGFPPDHPFRAHLTIGRVQGPLSAAQRDELRKALGSLSQAHPFDVSRVILIRSKLSPAGSEYSELASFPLSGA